MHAGSRTSEGKSFRIVLCCMYYPSRDEVGSAMVARRPMVYVSLMKPIRERDASLHTSPPTSTCIRPNNLIMFLCE